LILCLYERCQKFYDNLGKFFEHLRSHTKEKPFACEHPLCDKRFSLKANCDVHMANYEHWEKYDIASWFKSWVVIFRLNKFEGSFLIWKMCLIKLLRKIIQSIEPLNLKKHNESLIKWFLRTNIVQLQIFFFFIF
jgi:hypothetical protein